MSIIGASNGGNNINSISQGVSPGVKEKKEHRPPISAEPTPIQNESSEGENVQRRSVLDRIQNLDVSALDSNSDKSSGKLNEAKQNFNNWDTFNNWGK